MSKCNISEYKTEVDELILFKNNINQLNEIDTQASVLLFLDKMFLIENKLRKADKYFLLKYELSQNKENLTNKQDFWKIYSEFLTIKESKLEEIIKNYSLNELLNYDKASKYSRYIKKIFQKKSHLVSQKDSARYEKLLIDSEKIRDDFLKKEEWSSDIELLNQVKKYVVMRKEIAKLQNFNSVLERELFYDGIDISCFNNLINIFDTKKSVVKETKRIKNQDDNAVNKYTLEESIKLIEQLLLEVFDEEYLKKVNLIIANNCIDYYPRENKVDYNFTVGCLGCNPVISINYEEKLDDVRILIHELGHAVHLMYHGENNIVDYDYDAFLGEIVAMLNEILLLDKLKSGSNKSTREEARKSTILMYEWLFIDAIKALKLEHYIHNNYKNLDLDYIKKDKDWIIHISRVFFDYYDYKYAIGLCVATKLYLMIQTSDFDFNKLCQLLKASSNDNISDILKIVGINLNDKDFSKKLINDTFDFLENELKSLTS